MAASATHTYKGYGVTPCWYPEQARTLAVQLTPGTYSAGAVLGQCTTLTAANDVKTIETTGTPTGGTFRLAFSGQVTAEIARNASAATVQAALEALSNIGTGNVTCTGGALPTAVVATFGGKLANRKMPDITLYSNSLTGGSSPSVTITNTTPGRTKGGAWSAYASGASDGTDIARAVLQYDTVVDTFGKHTVAGGEWGESTSNAPVWTCGYFATADLGGLDSDAVNDLGRIVQGAVGSLSDAATVLSIH